MYVNVMKEMRTAVKSIYSQELDGNQFLVAREPCEDIYDVLGDIEFTLQNTKIVIKPKGYLYRKPKDSDDCYIGIQSIPDDAN